MAALWDASDAHAILVFRGQTLTDAQQIAFTENFGQPERYVFSYSSRIKLRLGRPEMADVSNLDAATGQPQTGSQRHRMVNLGNRLWHTDSSFRLPRGGFSLLYAHAVPPRSAPRRRDGVRRYLCRLRALTPQRQALLHGMQAEHSLMHSRAGWLHRFRAGGTPALPPVAQPLVNTHPAPGESRSTSRRMPRTSSAWKWPMDGCCCMELTELATRAGTTYRHEWRVGDLVLWDNRRSLHRGLPFDERFPRDMRRVTTSDGTEPARHARHAEMMA